MRIDVDAVRAACDLATVAARYGTVHRKGKTLTISAPWRSETKPSVALFPDGKWRDFGDPEKRGDVIDFVAHAEGLDFKAAYALLAQEFGIAPCSPEEARRTSDRKAVAVFLESYVSACVDAYSSSPCPAFVLERYGITDEDAARARLGFGVEWTAKDSRQPLQAGFKGRLIVPVYRRGAVVQIAARRLSDSDEDGPKWLRLTVPAPASPLYGIDAARRAERIAVVESYQAVICCAAEGVPAVATGGTTPAQEAIDELCGLESTLVLAYDPDQPGQSGALVLAAKLLEAGRSVALVDWGAETRDPPELHRDKPGELARYFAEAVDAVEWMARSVPETAGSEQRSAMDKFSRILSALPLSEQERAHAILKDRIGLSRAALKDLVKRNTKRCKPKDGRKLVALVGDVHEQTQAVLRAIDSSNNPPWLFVRSHAPCVLSGDKLRQLDVHHLRAELCSRFVFTRRGEPIEAPSLPLLENLLAQGRYPFPTCESVYYGPVFDTSFELVKSGYSPRIRAFVASSAAVDEPAPTAEEVASARQLLLDLVCDFPFVDEASRTHAIAYLLTLLVRPALDAQAPIFVFSAPSQGSGKDLLLEVLTSIATTSAPTPITEARNEDELGKKITTALLASATVINLANFNNAIDSGSIAAAVTQRYWADRAMHSHTQLELRSAATWTCTANNPSLSGEIGRRAVLIRLEPDAPCPWERSGFVRADLRTYAAESRAELLRAACTLVRAWDASDRPLCTMPLGSFERWARVIGGICAVAGLESFMGNRTQLWSQTARDSEEWEPFWTWLGQNYAGHYFAPGTLTEKAREQEFLDTARGAGNDKSQATRIGSAVGKQVGLVFGKFKVCKAKGRKGFVYGVERIE